MANSAQHTTPQGTGKPGAPVRIALWDNARFVIIALVVIGHVLTTTRMGSTLNYALYALIFLFHMPGMIVLSGYFSRATQSVRAARSTLQLLGTWVLFEGIWALLRWAIGDRDLPQSFLVVPGWTLWFLVTLVTLRILLPVIARTRAPLLISVLLALLGGLSPVLGAEFSAARTLSFLPFFVLGWLAKERGWLTGDWFLRPSRALRLGAIGVFAAIALVFALIPTLRELWRIDAWLVWRDSYASLLDAGAWTPVLGMGIRLALLMIATLMTFALLLLVPRTHSVITVWGTRTLYVYLLHGFVVYALRRTGVIDEIELWGLLGTVVLVVGGFLLTMLLSATAVTRAFRPVIEPQFSWLIRKDEESDSGPYRRPVSS